MGWVRSLLYALILVLPFALLGQDDTHSDFLGKLDQWDRTSEQAVLYLEDGETSEGQLNNVRAALVKNRDEAQDFIDNNQSIVKDLQAQLSALTPAPNEDGTTPEESPELSARRDNVQQVLATVQGDVLSANQYVTEANNLIDRVDAKRRQDLFDTLAARSPSPIGVDNLKSIADGFGGFLSAAGAEGQDRFAALRSSGFLEQQLPLLMILLLMVFGMIWFVRQIAHDQIKRITPWETRARRIFMPLATTISAAVAVFILIEIRNFAQSSENLGPLGAAILSAVFLCLILCVAVGWLRWTLLNENAENPVGKRHFGFLLYGLAIFIGLDWSLLGIAGSANIIPHWIATAHFVFLIIGSILIWALSGHDKFLAFYGYGDQVAYTTAKDVLRRMLRYLVLFSLLLSLVGYFAASYILFKIVIVAVFVFLEAYHLCRIFVHWIDGLLREFGFIDKDKDALSTQFWPILVQAVIWVFAAFQFLLGIGVPPALLNEIWARAQSGLRIGEVTLSFWGVLKMLVVFYIGYLIVSALKRLLAKNVFPRTNFDEGASAALNSLFGYFAYTIVGLIGLRMAGFDLTSVGYILGALSVGIGFGLQNIVSNFISGIILLIERPVKKGDWIEVGDNEGYVRNIAVRATEIETFDNASVIVPNADLISQPVINWQHNNNDSTRVRVPIGVSYDSEPEDIRKLLLEVAEQSEYALRVPKPLVIFMGYGENALNFELRYYIAQADNMVPAISDSNFLIAKVFRKNGVDIPFPRRDVRILKDEE